MRSEMGRGQCILGNQGYTSKGIFLSWDFECNLGAKLHDLADRETEAGCYF